MADRSPTLAAVAALAAVALAAAPALSAPAAKLSCEILPRIFSTPNFKYKLARVGNVGKGTIPAGAVVKVSAKKAQGGRLAITFKLSAPLAYGQTVVMPAPIPTDYTSCTARTRFLF
jgi:hypothetical protein